MAKMNTLRLRTVATWLLGTAVCAVLAWQILFAAARPRGSISISFVGFTNNASGAVSALFTLSNGFPRNLVVAAGAVQILQPKGWPAASVYGHPAGPVFTVAPKAAQEFAIRLPKVEGALWRVPLSYEKVDTRVEQWTERVKAALGLSKPGKSLHLTNTPVMRGASGQI